MKTDAKEKRRSRAYICHTYYHIYVTVLKELTRKSLESDDFEHENLAVPHSDTKESVCTDFANASPAQNELCTNSSKTTPAQNKLDTSHKADLILSRMSDEILSPGLFERLVSSDIFANVFYLDEKKESDFPALEKYRNPNASFIKKMLNRMAFTREFPKAMAPFIQTDFSLYDDVYVYCDEDPIAYYLNYKKIPYHALEDGLDCVVHCDVIINDEKKFLNLKLFLARLGLIFLPNGYSKYALDMEVNDLSRIKYPHKGWKEVPRENYVNLLTAKDQERILRLFIPNLQELKAACQSPKRTITQLTDKTPSDKAFSLENNGAFLLLTQPLCELPVRKQIFKDIIAQYANGVPVIIKPHPRDTLDYQKEFPSCLVLDANFPIEVLNFCKGIHFHTVLSVMTTAIDALTIADKKINLGWSFLDTYEDPALHTYI